MFKASCLILLILIQADISAQDFSGEYTLQEEGISVQLTLKEISPYQYTGTLLGNGMTFTLAGSLQNGRLVGQVEYQRIAFEVSRNSRDLTVKIFDLDQNGNSTSTPVQTLVFVEKTGRGLSGFGEEANISTVIINGVVLNELQLTEMEQKYGRKPLPGNYWYDTKSGLYGVVGYQAFGFMFPGHQFGQLSKDVSNGNTNVVVNGRELPRGEWVLWSYLLGYYIQPGSYWLDHRGNAGYESDPAPVINLYQAALANRYGGRGSGGDNFWTTRFSAGNSNSANTQGYVSVPGYGPVGYGFN